MKSVISHTGRIALGLTLSLAALGGGVASAAPTIGDGVSAQSAQAVTLAGARPAFKAPFQCGTQWRGSAWTTYNGVDHKPQKSVDWNWGSGNEDKGKLVRASAGGTVEIASGGHGGYGNMVLIRHGSSGWKTRYAHLLDGSIEVSPGNVIAQGKVIGKVGQSGGQDSSHLHYEQIADGSVRDAVVQGVTFAPNSVHYITSNNAC